MDWPQSNTANRNLVAIKEHAKIPHLIQNEPIHFCLNVC